MNDLNTNTNSQTVSANAGAPLRIIVAGGGTGGHIFPAIAIANAIKQTRPDTQFLFVGAKGKMEMEKVPQAGFKIEGLDIAGFDRGSLFKNISLPYKLLKSFTQVSGIFKRFKPDAVIGVGGYSSFPVLRYAQRKGVPTFIHESNSFAGKSNILLGKNATKVFVAGEGMEKFFPLEKIEITGNPVRKSIMQSSVTKGEALQHFGLDINKKTILAVGGSLGARSINEVLAEHISELGTLNLQLVWQTGKTTAEEYIQRGKGKPFVWVGDFIQDMDKAYAAADVVISRSGAMAVAELCIAKKAVVFVPFPFAAEGHQTANAKHLVDRNAALMVKDEEAKGKLFSTVTNLIFNDKKIAALEHNIAGLAVTDAADTIAVKILNSLP